MKILQQIKVGVFLDQPVHMIEAAVSWLKRRPNQLRLYDRKSSGDTKVAYTFYILPIKILESASYVICSSNT